ncbi:MAG TPA: zf-HC2 domain-containing protein, partial [Bryobacteraceae bacterium]|nr:zf-HC2 domain-containing protein [Bryobacteraceae bacterium]
MKCEEVRTTLPLFLYGELSFEDEERLEVHIDECDACRAALAREKALFQSLDAAEMTPSQELLDRCRAELQQSLAHAEPEREGFWDKVR